MNKKKCIEVLYKLEPKGIELNFFLILSIEDPDFSKHLDNQYECYYSVCPNKPLGVKKTFGLANAIKYYPDYDYIMELGSDDFINPKLFDLYKPLMNNGFKFFGMNNLYMYHVRTDKLIWVKDFAGEDMTFGAGRMIHKSVIEKMGCDLWDDYNEGLDTMSAKKIKSHGVSHMY